MEDRITELEKEIRELNLKLEIERQKVRRLEQENERLKEKLNRQMRAERQLKVSPAPVGVGASSANPATSPVVETFEGSVTEQEIEELRERLRKLTAQKDASEQEKWDQSKEVIENKEILQRLRVKKINIKKDIDELNERLDRKENQNFKSRLEITDLKKEEARARAEADEAEAERKELEAQIAQLEEEIARQKAILREERVARDRVQFLLNRALKIKAEYESHWLARFYNK